MGFMDKAKQLAEQAQQKLDDAQKQFKQGEGKEGQEAAGGVRYDQHGRPVEEPPAGSAPPPSAQPTDPAPAGDEPARSEPAGSGPAASEPAPQKPGADTSDANPDPFKPIQ